MAATHVRYGSIWQGVEKGIEIVLCDVRLMGAWQREVSNDECAHKYSESTRKGIRLMCLTDMQDCDQCYNTRRSKLSIVNTSPVEYAVRRANSRTVATFRQLVYILQTTVSAYASPFVGLSAMRRAIIIRHMEKWPIHRRSSCFFF